MNEHTLETIELELTILVRRVTSIATTIGNLDRSAYLLLRRISENGSAGVKTLAEEFHLDISTVSRQTAALEQKGYVYRIPDPTDGRSYSLQITEKGANELHDTKLARLERIAKRLKDWNDDEREQFGYLLTKFNRTSAD
jgi:DNA-binding MarR family transcriptional regulator